jgi:hypothetical protein
MIGSRERARKGTSFGRGKLWRVLAGGQISLVRDAAIVKKCERQGNICEAPRGKKMATTTSMDLLSGSIDILIMRYENRNFNGIVRARIHDFLKQL